MRLYHGSDLELSRLVPYRGSARHTNEDPRAVNRDVVWLSNQPMTWIREGVFGPRFQYVVEVEDNDPDLLLDELFAKTSRQMNKVFGSQLTLWYFYTKELLIAETQQWNPNSKAYEVTIPADSKHVP